MFVKLYMSKMLLMSRLLSLLQSQELSHPRRLKIVLGKVEGKITLSCKLANWMGPLVNEGKGDGSNAISDNQSSIT